MNNDAASPGQIRHDAGGWISGGCAPVPREHDAAAERDAYRAALELVLEGLAIPHAATVADDEKRAEILHERLMHVLLMVRAILEPRGLPAGWELNYCREKLAQHPATGYRAFGEPAGGEQ